MSSFEIGLQLLVNIIDNVDKKSSHLSSSHMISYDLMQGSATFNVKRAILAPFLPNIIHKVPLNIWCANIDSTAYN